VIGIKAVVSLVGQSNTYAFNFALTSESFAALAGAGASTPNPSPAPAMAAVPTCSKKERRESAIWRDTSPPLDVSTVNADAVQDSKAITAEGKATHFIVNYRVLN
jgi:hypothetical protein